MSLPPNPASAPTETAPDASGVSDAVQHDPPETVRIVQGHPTGFEPGLNKGGQIGAPKPDGRSAAAIYADVEGNLRDQLSDRLATLRARGATPSSIKMSPRSWDAIISEVGSEDGVVASDGVSRSFLGVPVNLDDAAEGLEIV